MAQNFRGEEDDIIIDDDWDDLPPEALTALEEQAIQFTQQEAHVIISTRRKTQHRLPKTLPAVPTTILRSREVHNQQQQSHGYVGDKVIRRGVLEKKTQTASEVTTARDVVRRGPVHDGHNEQPIGDQHQRGYGSVPYRGGPPNSKATSSQVEQPQIPGNDPQTTSNLEFQIQKLEKQLFGVQEEVKLRVGEVAIVRAREEKDKRELEGKLNAEQKRHEEDMARLNAELQRVGDEKDRLMTENKDFRHNLREDVQSTKNLKGAGGIQGPVREKVNSGGILSTPRKPRPKGYGDGFDDDEIMVISPIKSGGGGGGAGRRSNKGGTPTKIGGKRKKRSFQESPGKTLELSQSNRIIEEDEPPEDHRPLEDRMIEEDEPPLVNEPQEDKVVVQKINGRDGRYDFLQIILNHRTLGDSGLRTFEEFAKYHLPSNPEKSLASMLLDQLSCLNIKGKVEKLEVEVCKVLLKQWSNCLEEKYYRPIHSVNNLILFILALNNTMSKAPEVIDHLVPLVQLTIDINAIPRHQKAPVNSLKPEIKILAHLKLLHLTALGCMYQEDQHPNDPPIKGFWTRMRTDFVLTLLGNEAPIEEIGAMIELLSTSSLEGSLGPISSGIETQREHEYHLLDRLSFLLVFIPTDGVPWRYRWKAEETTRLRIGVLKLLGVFCCTRHGGEMLARHARVIGRLVQSMNDELDSLYDYHERRSLSAKQINLSARILHHLVKTQPNEILPLQEKEKLRLIPGGIYRFRVVLARLAMIYRDGNGGMVFEKEIDDDVIQMAREILEVSVNPEETETFAAAFTLRGIGDRSGGGGGD
ncbi:MAG: hypothetical protein M1816_007266 [Peltula sp. TS41687]|nr:MAG: hypothetical protein M1816_007266 [Peltula sp. TS41687]